jgi:hypothetical protein
MTTPQRRHPFEMFAATYVEDWTESALCAQVDRDFCFPERGENGHDHPYRQIRRVCGECPVRQQCAKRAYDGAEKFGYWAGVNAGAGSHADVMAKWAAIAGEQVA